MNIAYKNLENSFIINLDIFDIVRGKTFYNIAQYLIGFVAAQ